MALRRPWAALLTIPARQKPARRVVALTHKITDWSIGGRILGSGLLQVLRFLRCGIRGSPKARRVGDDRKRQLNTSR